MTDTEVLLAAADLIERNGLHKDNYWPEWPEPYAPGKPCCALGAILAVAGLNRPARRQSAERLAKIVGQVDDWSDAHTQAEAASATPTT